VLERERDVESIGIRNVKIGGEIGRHIDVTIDNNLLAIDLHRGFIQPFIQKDSNTDLGDYIGLGKLIDTLARFAAYKADAALTDVKRRIVNDAIALQEQDGYLGLMPPDRRFTTLWDIHEMSYLIYGLTMDYRYCQESRSLDAARRLATYLMDRWKAAPDTVPDLCVMSTLGSEEAFLALYAQTQDQQYLDFLTGFRKLQDWDQAIVTGRWGKLEGHAYDYLCRTLCQFQLSAWLLDPRLLRSANRVLDFMLNRDGMTITGAVGNLECWHDNQEGTLNLGESCATAYLIRFLDAVLRYSNNPLYGDIMERVIYNALFAAQSPDGRRIRYYAPFEGLRAYFGPDTYCCPNNFRRIIAELPEMVFYRTGEGLAVNLYTPSTATVDLGGEISLTVRQETEYPRSSSVVIHLDPSQPARFVVRLRIPRWCEGARVEVNSQPVATPVVKGAWLDLNRTWQANDRVTLDLPMPFRLIKGRKMQASRVAVMRGPTVFCLNRSRHPELSGKDLRLVALVPDGPDGPFDDDTVYPRGQACRVTAWGPGAHYPIPSKPDLSVTLTEFADPGGEAVYFKIPNPSTANLVDDELMMAAIRSSDVY